MKHKTQFAGLAGLLLAGLALSSARGEEMLWNLSLNKLAPGQPLTAVPYVAPCAGPQKVLVDPDNPLVGAAAVGALTSSPLLFTAVTTRGMKEPEMAAIADMISEVLLDIKNLDTAHKVRERVRELTARYPLPY